MFKLIRQIHLNMLWRSGHLSLFLSVLVILIGLTVGLIQAQSLLIATGTGWETEVAPSVVSTMQALPAVDCNVLTSPIIGYDISKGQTPDDIINFQNDLINGGYSLGTVDISSGSIPSCVDVLIIQSLKNNKKISLTYSVAQAALIKSWTSSGHGLMLSGDWGELGDVTDEIFFAYGYRQEGTAALTDTTDADPLGSANSWVIYQVDNFAPHPIFSGINSLELLAGSWLSPTTNIILTSDADAVPPSQPVMAAFENGAGCVLLSTDSNWITIEGYNKKENNKVAQAAISWLMNCNTTNPPPPPPTPAKFTVYLPNILAPSPFPIFIGNAIPIRLVTHRGEVFYTTSVQIPSKLPPGGHFYFSSSPTQLSPVKIDDDMIVQLNGTDYLVYHFSPTGGIVLPLTIEVSRNEMEVMAGNTVTIEYRDVYGNFVNASAVWLIWLP